MENLSSNNYKLWKSMENHGFFVRTEKLWKWHLFADDDLPTQDIERHFPATVWGSGPSACSPIARFRSDGKVISGECFEAHGPSGNPWQQNIPCKVDEWKFVERNRKLRFPAASSFVLPIGSDRWYPCLELFRTGLPPAFPVMPSFCS